MSDKKKIMTIELAMAGYDAYCAEVGGKAFNGDPLPGSQEFFEDESKEVQANAWVGAAIAIVDLLKGKEEAAQSIAKKVVGIELGAWQERLLIEAQETAVRLNLLNGFMASDDFPGLDREEKDLLYEQQRAMSVYLQILGKRLELAGKKFEHAGKDS